VLSATSSDRVRLQFPGYSWQVRVCLAGLVKKPYRGLEYRGHFILDSGSHIRNCLIPTAVGFLRSICLQLDQHLKAFHARDDSFSFRAHLDVPAPTNSAINSRFFRRKAALPLPPLRPLVKQAFSASHPYGAVPAP
jgi:hypothetical protein